MTTQNTQIDMDTVLKIVESNFDLLSKVAPTLKGYWDEKLAEIQNDLIIEADKKPTKSQKDLIVSLVDQAADEVVSNVKASPTLKYPKTKYTQRVFKVDRVTQRGINGNRLRVAIDKENLSVHRLAEDNWSKESIKIFEKVFTKIDDHFVASPKIKKIIKNAVTIQKNFRGYITRKSLSFKKTIIVDGKNITIEYDKSKKINMKKIKDPAIRREIYKKFLPDKCMLKHDNKKGNIWHAIWLDDKKCIQAIGDGKERQFLGRYSPFNHFAKTHYKETRGERGFTVNAMTEVEILQNYKWIPLNQAAIYYKIVFDKDDDEDLEELEEISDSDEDEQEVEFDKDDVVEFAHSSFPEMKLFIDSNLHVFNEKQELVGTYNGATDIIFP